ncbi:DUF4236 domain-containing protein [Vibrio fluvialis]|nr:DUF4236 domain-containing protein [Vibrio fluvialis]
MSVRFQKRITLLPFLWLNLSKTGFSLTIGCRFIKLNIGRRGLWLTGSLVGTGLSVRKKLGTTSNKKANDEASHEK